jgi:hypothetical protein
MLNVAYNGLNWSIKLDICALKKKRNITHILLFVGETFSNTRLLQQLSLWNGKIRGSSLPITHQKVSRIMVYLFPTSCWFNQIDTATPLRRLEESHTEFIWSNVDAGCHWTSLSLSFLNNYNNKVGLLTVM